MKTDHLSRADLNILLSYREALSFATSKRQFQQFTSMQEEAGTWAHDKGLQDQDQWLEEVNSSDPYGYFGSGPWEMWPQAQSWIIARGWMPGIKGAERMITSTLLGLYEIASSTPCKPLYNSHMDPDIPGFLLPLAHHDRVDQANIVQEVLRHADAAMDNWILPRLDVLLKLMDDDLVLAASGGYTPKHPEMQLRWGNRMAQAGAIKLQQATSTPSGDRPRPRM